MKRIVLIGASGHGKVCAEIAEKSEKYKEIIFVDDNPLIKKCGKYNVCGTVDDCYKYIEDDTYFFVSIGNHKHREKIQEKIEKRYGVVTTLIHPKAVISKAVSIGVGTVVMAGTVINPNVVIGKGCIINTSSSVDHDCNIADWCHVAVGAHICGTVNIGGGTWIGAGAIVNNNINICHNCVIGAGTLVIKNIDNPGTYVGVPAMKK